MTRKPFFVEIGLLGIKTRSEALWWLYASIFGSVAVAILTVLVVVSIFESSLALGIIAGAVMGGLLSCSSLWYRPCISWMDKNGGW